MKNVILNYLPFKFQMILIKNDCVNEFSFTASFFRHYCMKGSFNFLHLGQSLLSPLYTSGNRSDDA